MPTATEDLHHPRPQLRRPSWRDLSGEWGFAFDDDLRGLREEWHLRSDVFDRVIRVPYPFESPASGIGDRGYHSVFWYRLEVEASVAPAHRLLLHFGAVDYRAQVWVNGSPAAQHEGGHTPFSADVTAFLDGSGRMVIVVRAEDDPLDLCQPRGKQDWQPAPHAVWYDRTSGIWQPVWLEEVPETRVLSLRWSGDVDQRAVDLLLRLHADEPEGLRVRVVLRVGDRVLAEDVYAVRDQEMRRRIYLQEPEINLKQSPLLWSPNQPTLIDADITLERGGDVVDRIASYTALRNITTSRDKLLLNGRPYYLRLVLAQNFWPESHLAAPDAAALEREVRLIKELGFNGVRLHQKVEDPRFLAWCDRLGLLVWAEMPAAYSFDEKTVSRLTREWLEVLERDWSHPCIIAWVPFNESWGVPALARDRRQQDFVKALYHLTKSCDSDRLVIGNDGWEQSVTDVVTVHDYVWSGEVLRERYGERAALEHTLVHIQPGYRDVLLPDVAYVDAPVIISEFGGITVDRGTQPDGPAGQSWTDYGQVAGAADLLLGYTALVGALLDSPAIIGFCWTQLTDVQQERNGLLTEDRQPKVPMAELRAVTTRVSAAVPGDMVGEFTFGDYVSSPPRGPSELLGAPTGDPDGDPSVG